MRPEHRAQRIDELHVAIETANAARAAWERVADRHSDELAGLHGCTGLRAERLRAHHDAARYVALRRRDRLTRVLDRAEAELERLTIPPCPDCESGDPADHACDDCGAGYCATCVSATPPHLCFDCTRDRRAAAAEARLDGIREGDRL